MTPFVLAQKLNRIVRGVTFDGDVEKPYYIGNADSEQLSDDVLRKLYQEYVSENNGIPPTDAEEFEEFLAWLEERYEYFQIVVVEEMFHI